LNRVRMDRRVTGWRPTRAATKLVIPIDNPSASLIITPDGSRFRLTLAARDPRIREIPLVAENP
jgi:hypothetical protein